MDIEKFKLRNNKATYYKVKKDLSVMYIEPSFVYEMIYFDNTDLLEKELKDVFIEKDKKIKRISHLDKDVIEDRLFRSLVNKDKYHTLELANEMYLRDKKNLFDILYKLSLISSDENKLIKTYLFELMDIKYGYNPYILKNLIVYFIKSTNSYIDFNDKKSLEFFESNVTNLYKLIYEKQNSRVEKYNLQKLDLKANKKMTEVKEYIYICLNKMK
ncbi:hypothetical protein [Oceanivirga miroungae]|uniref:Uncharacterized protein n=1 Tax=Oceanivirga miroungae TaxID=1130046 RepID=A0A6I8MC01_9FUSO|nr:hypothetical protein [Oceanivirga miroungae]VWL85743.1 hypothetical protein OMES3154_01031 [Oceanivirga miroungae]